jgi:uncharacterized phiE125 gp8 family phage protein
MTEPITITEPISLTEAKLHLRLVANETDADDYTREDALLERLIQAAREEAEASTWRTLAERTRTMYLQDWPAGREIRLVGPPITDVEGVYYTLDGEEEAAFEDYEFRESDGTVVLGRNASWPTGTLAAADPIRIEYDAGYAVADVPAAIKSAMLLAIGDRYEHRETTVVGVAFSKNERAKKDLYSMYSVRNF